MKRKVEVIGSLRVSPKACEPAPELEAVQSLMPISREDRERLRESIQSEGVRDPIRAYREGKRFLILSGFNRWEIASELELETIPLEVIETDDREGYAIEDNLARRHLDSKKKGELVEYLLRKNPAKSNRQIAKEAGVDPQTVAPRRSRLESGGEIPHLKERIGSDGKQQKAQKQKAPLPAKLTPAQRTKAEKLAKEIRALEQQAEDLREKARAKVEQAKRKRAELRQIGQPSLFGL